MSSIQQHQHQHQRQEEQSLPLQPGDTTGGLVRSLDDLKPGDRVVIAQFGLKDRRVPKYLDRTWATVQVVGKQTVSVQPENYTSILSIKLDNINRRETEQEKQALLKLKSDLAAIRDSLASGELGTAVLPAVVAAADVNNPPWQAAPEAQNQTSSQEVQAEEVVADETDEEDGMLEFEPTDSSEEEAEEEQAAGVENSTATLFAGSSSSDDQDEDDAPKLASEAVEPAVVGTVEEPQAAVTNPIDPQTSEINLLIRLFPQPAGQAEEFREVWIGVRRSKEDLPAFHTCKAYELEGALPPGLLRLINQYFSETLPAAALAKGKPVSAGNATAAVGNITRKPGVIPVTNTATDKEGKKEKAPNEQLSFF